MKTERSATLALLEKQIVPIKKVGESHKHQLTFGGESVREKTPGWSSSQDVSRSSSVCTQTQVSKEYQIEESSKASRQKGTSNEYNDEHIQLLYQQVKQLAKPQTIDSLLSSIKQAESQLMGLRSETSQLEGDIRHLKRIRLGDKN